MAELGVAERDRFADGLGIELTQRSFDRAICHLKVGSKKFAHYQVTVTDGPGNCIAFFTSSAYKLSQ